MYKVHIPQAFLDSSKTIKNFKDLVEDKVELVGKDEANYIITPGPLVKNTTSNIEITIHNFMIKLNVGRNKFTFEEKTNIILMAMGKNSDKELALDIMFNVDFVEEYQFFQLYLVLAARDYFIKNNKKLQLLTGIWQNLRYIDNGVYHIITPGTLNGKYDFNMYFRLVQSFKLKGNCEETLKILENRSIIDVFLKPYGQYLKIGDIKVA